MLARSERHARSEPLEETPVIGGTIIAKATRTIQSATAIPRASSLRVATLNKRCNNPLAHLATGAMKASRQKINDGCNA
jgi:hypothetical protein